MTTAVTTRAAPGVATRHRQVALVDLLDRLLGGGVVIEGDIVLAAADVDLVALDLKLLISSIDKLSPR